jgi:hypothetical protein
MEATVTHSTRRNLEIQLDAEHVSKYGPAKLVLPTSYVAADVDDGYAVTCDKAQGATVDHVLYHPTDRSSSERAYVALSRGRRSNRIYAVNGAAWKKPWPVGEPTASLLINNPVALTNPTGRSTELGLRSGAMRRHVERGPSASGSARTVTTADLSRRQSGYPVAVTSQAERCPFSSARSTRKP